MKKTLIIILFLCFTTAYSQWSSSYSGSGSGDVNLQNVKGMANTIDAAGNVYAAGYVENTATGCDILLIKYKPAGDTAWTRTYNGTANSTDKAFGIVSDAAGNIYITGMAAISGRGSELILLKYSSAGVLLWVQTYGETRADLEDMGRAIGIDNMGNISVTGFSTGKDSKRNIILQKYSSAGILMFSKKEDGEEHLDSEGFGIAVDNSGSIFVTGYSNKQSTLSNIITIKYDNSGNEQWKSTFNGAADENDKAFGIAVDNSSNVYVTGYVTRTNDTNSTDAVLIKYNKKG
ncbi:MAG: SBBP repeat-containing protein [Ignavibacteria bacterium]